MKMKQRGGKMKQTLKERATQALKELSCQLDVSNDWYDIYCAIYDYIHELEQKVDTVTKNRKGRYEKPEIGGYDPEIDIG